MNKNIEDLEKWIFWIIDKENTVKKATDSLECSRIILARDLNKLNFNRTELAKYLGFSKAYVSDMLLERRTISVNTAKKIVKFLKSVSSVAELLKD